MTVQEFWLRLQGCCVLSVETVATKVLYHYKCFFFLMREKKIVALEIVQKAYVILMSLKLWFENLWPSPESLLALRKCTHSASHANY